MRLLDKVRKLTDPTWHPAPHYDSPIHLMSWGVKIKFCEFERCLVSLKQRWCTTTTVSDTDCIVDLCVLLHFLWTQSRPWRADEHDAADSPLLPIWCRTKVIAADCITMATQLSCHNVGGRDHIWSTDGECNYSPACRKDYLSFVEIAFFCCNVATILEIHNIAEIVYNIMNTMNIYAYLFKDFGNKIIKCSHNS